MPSSGCKTSALDRKSTRLNSSHGSISYAVFCLKKIKHSCYDPDAQVPPRARRDDRPCTRTPSAAGLETHRAALRDDAIAACCVAFFFFNDTAPTEIYTLSLHDALPISGLHAHVATLGHVYERRTVGCKSARVL